MVARLVSHFVDTGIHRVRQLLMVVSYLLVACLDLHVELGSTWNYCLD